MAFRKGVSGVERGWCPDWSSKPACPADTRVGGFDSHTPPPYRAGLSGGSREDPGRSSGSLRLSRDTLGSSGGERGVGVQRCLRWLCRAALVGLFGVWVPFPTGAQGMPPAEATSPQVPTQVSPDTLSPPFTPRGVFLRSLVLPGWGHAVMGAPLRGAFYFAADAAALFMLWKTDTRLKRARERRRLLEGTLEARLLAAGLAPPQARAGVAQDPRVQDLISLERDRADQKEDWMALGIFLLFLGGADAFVSAHLADFPGALVVEAGLGGGVAMGISLPVRR